LGSNGKPVAKPSEIIAPYADHDQISGG